MRKQAEIAAKRPGAVEGLPKKRKSASKAKSAARKTGPESRKSRPISQEPEKIAIPKSLGPALSSKEKQVLKGHAHNLEPIVWIGKEGVNDAQAQAIHEAVLAHELIKIRLPQVEKDERESLTQALAARAVVHIVQSMGRMVTVYRRHPNRPRKFV